MLLLVIQGVAQAAEFSLNQMNLAKKTRLGKHEPAMKLANTTLAAALRAQIEVSTVEGRG